MAKTEELEAEVKPAPKKSLVNKTTPVKAVTSTSKVTSKKSPVVRKKRTTPKVTHPPKKVTRMKTFSFIGKNEKKYELTEQQKLFAELFCQLSMNGVDAIIEAGYNVTNRWGGINYKLAAVMAKENLLKPNIAAYISTLYERYGLNDEAVDGELLAVINQNAELSPKIKAIDIYYKKKGEYASDKNDSKFNSTIEEMANKLSKMLP